MALDPRFIVTSDLESYFVDKDSGLPLAGGIVTFYSDLNRMTKKPVYQITDSPPNYTYSALPNPCVLSDTGTFQDALGNNIVPYYFPYQGTPSNSTGIIELYYITVQSSGFIPQFTRQGWPNSTGAINPSNSAGDKNFIPNGQFLAHNDIVSATEPPVTTYAFGSGNIDSQAIAQGGWSFQRTTGGTSVFTNSFTTAPVSGGFGLNDFPRYAFNFACTTFNNSDQYRDLVISWPDVNKFSGGSPPGSQDYTLFFNAKSNDSNPYVFQIYLIQYFGTGGSPTTPIPTLLSTVTVGTGYGPHTIHITGFPSASTATLGTNNDDYVALAIRGPASSWDAQFTDFVLLEGNATITTFPVQTNAEMLSEGVAGWMPTPAADGSDLYLPLVLTPGGMTFDDGDIGKARASTTFVDSASISTTTNELKCDGSQYLTTAYSPLGIPYARLQRKYFNTTTNFPIWGTGSNYKSAYINSGSSGVKIILTGNKPGIQTVAANGVSSPTFTYQTLSPGSAGVSYRGNSNSIGLVTLRFLSSSALLADPSAGTSTMTVTNMTDNASTLIHKYFTIQAKAASALAAGAVTPGLYFTFSTNAVNYYVWFQQSTETDPAPGGTGIKINMTSDMLAFDIGVLIANAVSGNQVEQITLVPVSTPIPASSYFTFFANSQEYYIWYTVDGVGTDPSVVSSIGFKVELITGDTAAIVASKTQRVMNSAYYAVPDFGGVFLRNVDYVPTFDIDILNRYGLEATLSGSQVGSYELSKFSDHIHLAASSSTSTSTLSGATANKPGGSGGIFIDTFGSGLSVTASGGSSTVNSLAVTGTVTTGTTTTTTISDTGSSETNPVNVYVNYYIKY